MTKHSSGQHGRTVGRKEPKAGWPAPAKAWCYRCQGTHNWEDSCPAHRSDITAPATLSASSAGLPASALDR